MITLERQSILSTEISAVDSRDGIGSALGRITHEFGFRHFMLVRASNQTDEALLGRLLVESNMPKDYVKEFDRLRLLQKCPVSPIVASSSLPICWSLDETDQTRGFSFPREISDLQRSYGMITSVAMALHSIDGKSFTMFFSGTRPRLTQVELNEIGMILLHAFGVFDKIRRSAGFQSAGPLSTRELEVVRWTAQGKTSSEIGRILSLSDHTVNAYMTNAIKKLDCVNRTQLVAKALRLRLII